ncbi:hypothetical protein, partial [Desulfosarcina cetonica]|uniref:hypothetical protein n=1 Tax=Desulfosarcina cetonica TaxID=90730 RepID=UPI00155DB413
SILSQGVYVESTAKILTHSKEELSKIEHADGWGTQTSDQWLCATKSIDLHAGLLLSYFAQQNINAPQITQLLMDNYYLPHIDVVGNLRNRYTLKSELIKIGSPAVPVMIEMLTGGDEKTQVNGNVYLKH